MSYSTVSSKLHNLVQINCGKIVLSSIVAGRPAGAEYVGPAIVARLSLLVDSWHGSCDNYFDGNSIPNFM